MPIPANDIDSNWTDGVFVTSTFDAWRKKTNGVINAYNTNTLLADRSILPIKLSTGAPDWTSAGNVTITGTLGATVITGTSLNAGTGTIVGGAITGTSLGLGSGTITTTGTITSGVFNGRTLTLSGGTGLISTNGAVNSLSLGVGTSNVQFTVSSAGAIVGTSLNAGSGAITTTGAIGGGAITGTSLGLGSGAITTTGAISSGAITGTSLGLGSGAITTTGTIGSGAITCTALNAGSGTITTTGNAIAATPTLPTHLATKAYVDADITAERLDGGQTGSAPIFGARAWGYCNAAGTLIQGGNIDSVVKTATGVYQVFFTTSLPNAFYAISAITELDYSALGTTQTYISAQSASGFVIVTRFRDNSGDKLAMDIAFRFIVVG